MNANVSQTTWHGLPAWTLENDFLRTVIVPEPGAKLVSLVDKRSQREWLVGPGNRPLKKIPDGAAFVDQDMSGWDEMFPTIVACAYPGSRSAAGHTPARPRRGLGIALGGRRGRHGQIDAQH